MGTIVANDNVLTVRTITQRALFELELKGQISDGAWENARPYDHYKMWCSARVEVGDNVGRNFYPLRTSYNFTRKDLLDVVANRMLFIARITLGLGIDVAREVHDLCIIGLDDDGNARLDWEPTESGEYWDEKRRRIALLDRLAIDHAVGNTAYTRRYLVRELRDLGRIVKMTVW